MKLLDNDPRYVLLSLFGLRYWVILRRDVDHAILAGELVEPERSEQVVTAKLAAAGRWRWRWQRKDGSMRRPW